MLRYNDERINRMIENRPKFKSKAVITGGMPYGNKELHFGHIGGMFVFADVFARFLRDRIGSENVLFVSGTDCFGSPILEGYRKLKQSTGFDGSIEDWVNKNHSIQKQTLLDYEIGLNFFGASGLAPAKDVHKEMSDFVINKLYENKSLEKLSVLQFYDKKYNCFLNGRQVVGKCPFEGCQSEKGYADECDLGHQYMPSELINPVSTLSNEKPELRETANWYYKLEDSVEDLKKWIEHLEKNTVTRSFITKEIKEFLKKPEIYIKKEFENDFEQIKNSIPAFTRKEDTKSSFTIEFEKLTDREKACEVLTTSGIRYRTGKTLVPFRLTGNCEWGVPTPEIEGLKDLTFWVWPESLWAPMSFTETYLRLNNSKENWKDYWCNPECAIYQFIGEDNIYFYGPAQHGMWLSMYNTKDVSNIEKGSLQISQLVANKHILFLDKKASSSSAVKPPMAKDLLNFYTPEQLRFHFISLGLGNNSVSFMPKPYNPNATENEADPVLNQGNLLTNVFNRALRTLFYTWQSEFNGVMPYGEVSEKVLSDCTMSILKYEKFMYEHKFHMTTYELDTLIRNLNKNLSKQINDANGDKELIKQALVDGLHMAKTALVLLHPICPSSCESLAEFMHVDKSIFNWDKVDSTIYEFVEDKENHRPNTLEPKQDFFKKHPSQLA